MQALPSATWRASSLQQRKGRRVGEQLMAASAAAPEVQRTTSTSGSNRWLRPHLLKLAPYTPIEPFEVLADKYGRTPDKIIKLDANENPYGPPPEVREALASMPFPHIYPDPETRTLRKALAEMNDIPMEHLLVRQRHERAPGGRFPRPLPAPRGSHRMPSRQLHGRPSHPTPLHPTHTPRQHTHTHTPSSARRHPAALRRRTQVGCGADELIDLLMRCCLDSGDRIVDCPPTFTMYAFDAEVNDARVVTVPRLDGFRIDVEGIRWAAVGAGATGTLCSVCRTSTWAGAPWGFGRPRLAARQSPPSPSSCALFRPRTTDGRWRSTGRACSS